MFDQNLKNIALLILLEGRPSQQVFAHCMRAMRTNDLGILSDIRLDPSSYATADKYFRDVQAISLLKKLEADDPHTAGARRARALATWHDAERQCAYTNRRLADFTHNTAFYDGKDERLWIFVQKCKKLLRRWLGRIPDDLHLRFGPGATFSDRGHRSTIMDKMSSRPTLTEGADIVLPLWTRTAWFRGLTEAYPDRSDPEIVRGNRFATVPKDSRKDRCIGIEPSLNVSYQLAVGRVLRARLKAIGIDLNRGQEKHRDVARMGSLNDMTESYMRQDVATLDLSSASDTISTNLVKVLLPPEWYELLEALRSPYTLVDGKWYRLEKFSSMGNGFTFELETLIFLTLLTAMSDDELIPGKNLLVYGDDIIIPRRFVEGAIGVLSWAGFTLNREKSYWSGPFRESCGGDYFLGVAVRPVFIKEAPSSPADWIALANSFYRAAVEHNWGGDFRLCEGMKSKAVLGWFHPAWTYCLSQIPNRIRRIRGPMALGDVVIHDSRETWSYRVRNSIRYFEAYVGKSPRRKLSRYPGSVALAALLYGVPAAGVSPRGAPTYHKPLWVPFS